MTDEWSVLAKSVWEFARGCMATYRALGVRPHRPTADDDAANAVLWQVGSLGALPFGWARPDGSPIDNASWATTRVWVVFATVPLSSGG